MDTEKLNINKEATPVPTKKSKKGIAGLIVFVLVLVLAIGGGAGYYIYQRKLPQETVTQFLVSMQKMDLDKMASLLQSSDLSALDNADIRDEAFTEFFKSINQKMSFKLTKTDFDIQNGTARITAHIKYIDGTSIYKDTITEFLRQVVSTAFSGEQMTEEETQQKLASILNEKASDAEDVFSETDIIYPLIKTDNTWKIVALDEETVKIMSANFKSVEDEINRSLSDTNDDSSDDTSAEVSEASDGETIDMTTDKFTIRYTHYKISRDFAGKPCIMVYYDYTNHSSSPSSAMVDVSLKAYQHGTACEAAIPESTDDAIDQYMAEIKSGETVNVCQAFSLSDESDVTLQAEEAFSFEKGDVTSQTLKVK